MSSAMGFGVEYSSSVAAYLPLKIALVFAIVRWLLSYALEFFLSLPVSDPTPSDPPIQISPTPSKIGELLGLSTFEEVARDVPGECDTCAVCLRRMRRRDPVRQLGNCRHAFHRRCIDRWLDHDVYATCPLCRAPLLPEMAVPASTSCLPAELDPPAATPQQPSWAVERLLYLFGDDLYC
ncbi:hypothetical protein NMG60_11005691 [Bertholletia excelsa]